MQLFKRRAPRECFFCLTPDERGTADSSGLGGLGPNVNPANGRPPLGAKSSSSSAQAASAWCCSACGCWNVRDRNGIIVSDLPAMHNSSLNGKSFALRGQPSTSRLPSASNPSIAFCRDCITNQTLVMNLLGNYLPDESDPSYAALEAELPRYVASLHERYPPVCDRCQPTVDEVLKRSDQRAQAEAWGRALRRGRTLENPAAGRALSAFEVGMWRARGAMWMLDAAISWGLGLCAWAWPEFLGKMVDSRVLGLRFTTVMLILRGLSILWALWDPTWLRRARAGGEIRLEGRGAWVTAMLAILCLRAGVGIYLTMWRRDTSRKPTVLVQTAVSDAIALVAALYQLKVSEPVALTLVRPVQSSSSRAPPPVSLSSLSLDPTPTPPPATTPPVAPVFGLPSLAAQPPRDESEPMDWEPAPARGTDTPEDRSEWDSFGVGRQRMFPNGSANDETGLENLLAGWGISTGSAAGTTSQSQPLPMAPLAPSRGLVLDDALVRKFRSFLLILRCLALCAAVACVSVQLSIEDMAPRPLRALLALEAAASTLALVVCLVSRSGRMVPLAAIVLASDAVVRLSALMSTALPSSLPHEALAWAGPEIACATWAVLDGMVLAAT